MPSIVKLVSISTLDDVEIMSGIHLLRGLPEEILFLGWYHDVHYGNDEYGCTSVPNIFHNWLVKRSDLEAGQLTHVNALGSECTDFVAGRIEYIPDKKLLILGGYRYTSTGAGYPKVIFIDVTDPENPSVLKEIEYPSEYTGSPYATPLYNPKHNLLFIGVHKAFKVYYDTLENVMNVTSIDQIPNSIDGYYIVYPLDEDRILMMSSGNTLDGYDIVNQQIISLGWEFGISFRTPNYLVYVYKDANNHVIVRFVNLSDLSIANEYNTNSEVSGWVHDYVTIIGAGDKVIVINAESNELFVVDPDNGIEYSTTLPEQCVWGARTDDGIIYCTHLYTGKGDIKKFEADQYYKVSIQGATVCVTDKDGNPLANKPVYVSDIYGYMPLRSVNQKYYAGAKTLTQLTTNSQGCVDLSQFAGKTVVIIVPP